MQVEMKVGMLEPSSRQGSEQIGPFENLHKPSGTRV